jgi:AcrR family transcriptional regulator
MPQGLQIDSPAETTDPRIRRSRHLLMDALAKLLIKKDFNDISIQEIAAEATLNRATFYLHYPDKDALLQAMTDVRFRDLIERRGISFTDCDAALRAIALGVCDYLSETTRCPGQLARIPLEGSIIPGRRGHVQGRPWPSWDGAWCRCGTAGDHRGLGHLRSRAPLVSDSRPHPR